MTGQVDRRCIDDEVVHLFVVERLMSGEVTAAQSSRCSRLGIERPGKHRCDMISELRTTVRRTHARRRPFVCVARPRRPSATSAARRRAR